MRLVERGVVVACASRYMSGGQQVGGPAFKSFLSKAAGRSLHLLARVGHARRDQLVQGLLDRTSSATVGIESRAGFEMGIELTAKARRLRLPVAEIPTIWLEREQGVSNFKVASWIPAVPPLVPLRVRPAAHARTSSSRSSHATEERL